MVYKMKKARRHGETHDRVRALLGEFAEDDGNVVRVFKDEDSVAHCITFATRQMRQYFAAFPEILLIDATHGTNDSLYKLFSIMVTDTFGHGQFVQHAVIDSENKTNMTSAIQAFKECNPQWKEGLKVLMVRMFSYASNYAS